MKHKLFFLLFITVSSLCCNKKDDPVITPEIFSVNAFSLNGVTAPHYYNTSYSPEIKIAFTAPVDKNLVASNVLLRMNGTADNVV